MDDSFELTTNEIQALIFCIRLAQVNEDVPNDYEQALVEKLTKRYYVVLENELSNEVREENREKYLRLSQDLIIKIEDLVNAEAGRVKSRQEIFRLLLDKE